MREQIYRKLRELGYGAREGVGAEESRLALWRSWYEGEVEHFHHYRVYNGQKRVPCRRASLGMAKKVCEDWANLLMNEQVRITAEGSREQRFLDRVLEENRFFLMANRLQERKAALGTAAYVPRVSEGRICLDYPDAEGILPLSWENGEVRDCAFAATRCSGGRELLYLQVHRRVSGLYEIDNLLFDAENGALRQLPLESEADFAGVPERVQTGRGTRSFVLDRMNLVNNLDPASPMGISVFANAIDQLRGADLVYDSYVNEFVLGKKRIMLKPEATKDFDGAPLFDTDELAFYILPEDSGNGSVIREIDMTLRTAEHHAGIQDMLSLLGDRCGFGERYYRLDQGSVKTATQVISENNSLFRNIRKHELLLEAALKELMRILLRLGNDYCGEELDEETGIRIDFDDSIMEDRGSDFRRDCRMLELGVMTGEEFRKRWMTEEEKKT